MLNGNGKTLGPTEQLVLDSGAVNFTDLPGLLADRLPRLPHVMRLLAENHIRTTGEVEPLLCGLDAWLGANKTSFEFTFQPNRILMHDTTCTPALSDVAGLRDAIAEAGGNPQLLSPQLPVEVSVDHSLAVDRYATSNAATINLTNEIERNNERYAFMKWAAKSMHSVHVNPPGTGIMHTINLEQLASVLSMHPEGLVHPDMLLGTDSHTPMINGIGVLGWGIGGLEAESVMFGQPSSLAMPEVIGVHLDGELPKGTLATDLALLITSRLREFNVTGCFVEFYGPGVSHLAAGSRSVIANMAPEYGASTGFFGVDQQTVDYLINTARPKKLTNAIEPVFKAMGLWFDASQKPQFNREIYIDLASLKPVIAGPRRPQDCRIPALAQPCIEEAIERKLKDVHEGEVPDGAVGIAAITSCTNTSDAYLLIAAGLLARKAHQYGLDVPFWVKTSLAPGSPSAGLYLERAGLLDDLKALGFDIVGYGCTTCIGNPGPLPDVIETALEDDKAVCAVLSGNRNFPGRVHPKLNLGYLASPPLVIAYAIKGLIRGDILNDPISYDKTGKPVYLSDIWPDEEDIGRLLKKALCSEDVPKAFATASENEYWNSIECPDTAQFPWQLNSRNLRRPKFTSSNEKSRLGSYSAAPLMVLGNDMTTDHISPAGWINPDSFAGQWLIERGGDPQNLNVYASYRGNWEVMLRGLFTNHLARNYLSDNIPPAFTQLADGEQLPVFEAAAKLEKIGQSTVILAGERYGMGSSRDWAAKGVALLGVRAVIARSFERIHRSNLIGMGVVPLQIIDDFNPMKAGIIPEDRIHIDLQSSEIEPRLSFSIVLEKENNKTQEIKVRVAIETRQELETVSAGGVLPLILEQFLKQS